MFYVKIIHGSINKLNGETNMYKICKTEKSQKRQIEVERALYELLKKKNYDDITVTELCESVNMPRKAFYRYFDEKKDVLDFMLDQTLTKYGYFFNSNLKRNHRKELEEYFRFWLENKELLEILDKNDLINSLFECVSRFPVKDIISVSKYLPDDNEWARTKIFEFAIFGLLFEAINWYKEGFKTDISDIVDITVRLLCHPLFPYLNKK